MHYAAHTVNSTRYALWTVWSWRAEESCASKRHCVDNAVERLNISTVDLDIFKIRLYLYRVKRRCVYGCYMGH